MSKLEDLKGKHGKFITHTKCCVCGSEIIQVNTCDACQHKKNAELEEGWF